MDKIVQKNMRKLFDHINNKELKLLKQSQFLPLWELVYNLFEEMNIDKRKNVNIFLSRSPTYFPSIEEHHNVIYLIIPMNFLSLVIKSKGEAKAILAHEFAHILQGDTNLWLQVSIYSKRTHRVYFPFFLLFTLFLITTLLMNPVIVNFGTISQILFLCGITISSLYLRKDCVIGRNNSEKLADTASMIYTKPEDLISVLKKYSINTKSIIHPPIEERIKHVKLKM